MYLVMNLDGKEIAKSQLLPTSNVFKEIEALKKQYRNEIQAAHAEPEFYISEVPSVANHFKSLLPKSKKEMS